YVQRGDEGGLRHLGFLYLGAIVGQLLAAYWQQYLTMVVAQRSLADLRVALFARVQRFPMRFFDRNPVGRIVSRLTTDVDVLQEAISGMAAIALAGREARAFAEFERLNADHRDANHLSNKLEAALFSFVEAVSTVSIALMLWEGGRLHGAGLAELGTVVAFIQYIQKFFVPIRDFSAKYAVMQSSMTAADRIFALLDLETEPAPAHARVPARVRGEIEFEHVWFAYRGEQWVLRDVSLRLAAGEHAWLLRARRQGTWSHCVVITGCSECEWIAVRSGGRASRFVRSGL